MGAPRRFFLGGKVRKQKYEKVKANQWVQPVRKNYLMACCDCCLVHELDFRVRGGRVQFRARRNNRKTAGLRRSSGIEVRR